MSKSIREVRRKTLEAIEVFRSLGAKVEEVDLGWTSAVDLDALHWYNTMNFGRQTIWQRKSQCPSHDRLRPQIRRSC